MAFVTQTLNLTSDNRLDKRKGDEISGNIERSKI